MPVNRSMLLGPSTWKSSPGTILALPIILHCYTLVFLLGHSDRMSVVSSATTATSDKGQELGYPEDTSLCGFRFQFATERNSLKSQKVGVKPLEITILRRL